MVFANLINSFTYGQCVKPKYLETRKYLGKLKKTLNLDQVFLESFSPGLTKDLGIGLVGNVKVSSELGLVKKAFWLVDHIRMDRDKKFTT